MRIVTRVPLADIYVEPPLSEEAASAREIAGLPPHVPAALPVPLLLNSLPGSHVTLGGDLTAEDEVELARVLVQGALAANTGNGSYVSVGTNLRSDGRMDVGGNLSIRGSLIVTNARGYVFTAEQDRMGLGMVQMAGRLRVGGPSLPIPYRLNSPSTPHFAKAHRYFMFYLGAFIPVFDNYAR